MISSYASGSVQVQLHSPGVSDLLLVFQEPDVIDNCNFQPCVRHGLFEVDKVLSFVPPGGVFDMMWHRVKNAYQHIITLPIY